MPLQIGSLIERCGRFVHRNLHFALNLHFSIIINFINDLIFHPTVFFDFTIFASTLIQSSVFWFEIYIYMYIYTSWNELQGFGQLIDKYLWYTNLCFELPLILSKVWNFNLPCSLVDQISKLSRLDKLHTDKNSSYNLSEDLRFASCCRNVCDTRAQS